MKSVLLPVFGLPMRATLIVASVVAAAVMSKQELIVPRTLKGFRDYLPAAMIPRERLIATAQRVYRSFGFSPIDTPALEYLEVLTGKGGDESDRQMYQFEDNGGRKVGMLQHLFLQRSLCLSAQFAIFDDHRQLALELRERNRPALGGGGDSW